MQYYSGKPRAAIYQPPTSHKRPSPLMLLAIIIPLTIALAAGAAFIVNMVAQASSSNVPAAKLANSSNTNNLSTTGTTNTDTMSSSSANSTTSGGDANNHTGSSNANTNSSTNTNANTNTTNTASSASGSGTTNIQAQQANCTVNGIMIGHCNGSISLKLMHGTSVTCTFMQSNNLVTLNCPSGHISKSATTSAQLTCEVNTVMINGCNGTATITVPNDATTCSLMTTNNTVAFTCQSQQPGQSSPPVKAHW